MDGFGFLDEFSKFHEDIVTRTSIYMLTSSNDPNEIERALKYPVVKNTSSSPLSKDILNQQKNRTLSYEVLYYSLCCLLIILLSYFN
jgi:cytochrome oxidase assembly protein ShyY1